MIYVLQVQTGREPYICAELKRSEITAYNPREIILIRKSGLWTKKNIELFPGYVFADIDYKAKTHHTIKRIEGVIRFLGAPTPLPKAEAERILWLANGGNVIEPSEAITDEEGNITAFEGFLKDCEDKICYINRRQKKASVIVKFGGSSHKTNISFDYKCKESTGQG